MNLLPSGVLHLGLVLVSGGSNGTNTLSSTEYWNGTNWATDGVMVAPVQQHVSVALGNSILIAGGAINNGSTTVSAAEVYDPSIALGCTSGSQCASGFCVSGVCCDSACNGGCGSCNLAGHLGICTPLTSGSVCRALAGICDAAETCDGSSLACPNDAFQPPATICRASAGVCDVAETCTGASAACPQDGFASAATECRPAAGACDTAENCTGTGPSCPADMKAADGTSCNDGNACTNNDVCTAGTCAGTPYACDDGLACTADTCNGDGTCTFSVIAGNCFVDGSCYADSDTNPGNQCQQCTSATSRTAWSQKAQGAPCNDQNACTANDVCDGVGHCGTPNAPSCDDSNPCTDDICDPAQGCSHPISPSQSGQVCSRNGCAANICISGSCLSDPLHTSCLTGQVPGTGFSTGSGIDRPTVPTSTAITPVADGSYATYYSYQFGDVNRFAAKIATRRSGDHIEVHLDTLAGPLIADLETIATLPADPNDDPTIDDPTSYQRETTPLVTVPTGPHDVYFVFKNGTAGAWGGPGPWIRLAWFEFYKGRGNVDVSYVPPNSIADDPILKGTPIASQVDWAHVSAVGKNEDLPEGARWHQYKQPAVIQPSQTASSVLRLRYSMVVSVSLTWTGGPGPLEFGIYDEQDHLLVAGEPRMGRLSGTVGATTGPVSLERLVLRATNNGNTPLTVSAILGLWPNETTPGP